MESEQQIECGSDIPEIKIETPSPKPSTSTSIKESVENITSSEDESPKIIIVKADVHHRLSSSSSDTEYIEETKDPFCFCYKRPPNDSDSDESSNHPKKTKNNSFQSKQLYREDINVCFQNSVTSEFNSNIENNNTTPVNVNKTSSEDTLLYLEQQYKNPINLNTSKSLKKEKTNIDHLLSGIDAENTTTLSMPAIICTSRLQRDENNTIMTCAPRLNARYSNVFNNSVTHLIVKVDHENCIVYQTIEYLLAIAHGIWVLNYSWFTDSLNQNRLLPEKPYEVLDLSGAPGPKLSRLNRKRCPVFKDFVFYIFDPVVTVTREDLETVIINLGGIIKTKPEELQNIPGKHCLILAEPGCSVNIDIFENWKDQLNLMSVDIAWVSETVGRFKLTSIRPYAICSIENIENYGYPSSLIAQVPESQM